MIMQKISEIGLKILLGAIAVSFVLALVLEASSPPPATPVAHPAAIAAAAPKATKPTPLPAPAQPPAGMRPGWVADRVAARNQFNQWVTLHQHTVQAATFSMTTARIPAGASGTRRTTWTGWIRTAQAVQAVTVHVAGGSALVTAQVDSWAVSVTHSNAWSAAPSQSQKVITLATGWHHVIVSADQAAGAMPASVELQIGSTDTDPAIPVPWAIPAIGPATASPTKSAASSAADHPFLPGLCLCTSPPTQRRIVDGA